MKRIRVFNTLGECYTAKALLECSGLDVVMKNEFGSNTVGSGPAGVLPFSLPELWVLNDEQLPDAMNILSEFKTDSNEPNPTNDSSPAS